MPLSDSSKWLAENEIQVTGCLKHKAQVILDAVEAQIGKKACLEMLKKSKKNF